ncbi:MAG: VOC family protein [Acidobacteriales bacterium]|nr:VOC family protein [Terriglobales bacterium]
MKLEKIGVLMLGVKDLKAAVDFYTDKLGLPLQAEIPGFAFFHAAFRTLQDRGITFQAEPHQVTQNDWAANFTDPDGHRLSVFGPPGN